MSGVDPATVAKKSASRSTPPTTPRMVSPLGRVPAARALRPRTSIQTPASPNVAKPRGSVGDRSPAARPDPARIAAYTPCAADSRV